MKFKEFKTKEAIIKKEINLPNTNMVPNSGRIFCIAIELTDLKTSSGIYVPGHVLKGDDFNPKGQTINRRIYMVVKVADDVKEYLPIERNDTIYPFRPSQAVGYDETYVFDPEIGLDLITFHYTEIAGYKKEPKEISKKNK